MAQIIKSVMASADEAETEALYITAKNMTTLRNILIGMGWPQPKSPIQKDKSTAVGFTNKTIVNKATISADIKIIVAQRQGITRPVQILLGTGI